MIEFLKKSSISILIILYFYVINFLIFDFWHFYEYDYYICFLLGVLPHALSRYMAIALEKTIFDYSAKFSLMFLSAWYVVYGALVEEVILKIHGLALFLIVGLLLMLCTNNNWPYKTDDGLLFKLKYPLYCKILALLNWGTMTFIVYLFFIGNWGI